jgi:hypothetical protein
MEFFLVILAAPVAIWIIDRLFYRGEFAQAAVESFYDIRDARRKARKSRRPASTGETG